MNKLNKCFVAVTAGLVFGLGATIAVTANPEPYWCEATDGNGTWYRFEARANRCDIRDAVAMPRREFEAHQATHAPVILPRDVPDYDLAIAHTQAAVGYGIRRRIKLGPWELWKAE